MPWYNKDAYDEKDDDEWPTDDLQSHFGLDKDLKDVEEYVSEYDE